MEALNHEQNSDTILLPSKGVGQEKRQKQMR